MRIVLVHLAAFAGLMVCTLTDALAPERVTAKACRCCYGCRCKERCDCTREGGWCSTSCECK